VPARFYCLTPTQIVIPIPTVIPSKARDLGVCPLQRYWRRRQEPRSLASLGTTTLFNPSENDLAPEEKALARIEPELCISENFYFTLAKMITSVYSASDSIRARPKISAS
jgi:hypothetical protein